MCHSLCCSSVASISTTFSSMPQLLVKIVLFGIVLPALVEGRYLKSGGTIVVPTDDEGGSENVGLIITGIACGLTLLCCALRIAGKVSEQRAAQEHQAKVIRATAAANKEHSLKLEHTSSFKSLIKVQPTSSVLICPVFARWMSDVCILLARHFTIAK